MAERRMFTMKIIDSDAFLDMPLTAQALYFHLNMRADDDGFVNAPRKIQRMVGASESDLQLLIDNRFVLSFDNGIIAIKHWKMHNLLRKDRYTPTQYAEEKALLEVKNNGAYTEKKPGNHLATTWQPDGNQMATQYSIGKGSIGEEREGKEREGEEPPFPPAQVYGEYGNVVLTYTELAKLKTEFPDNWQQRIEALSLYMKSSGKPYDDHYATIRSWAQREQQQQQQKPAAPRKNGNVFLEILNGGVNE